MSDMHDDIPVKDMPEAHRTKSLVMDKDHRTLRRDEFEDRIHQLTDENVFLKKHSRKFEEKAKQLEAKLNRILSEKKFLGRKDEIDVEESKHRIIELEYQVGMLKDKLQVAKQQLVSYTRMFPVPSNKQIKSKSNKVPTSNSSSAGLAPNSELSEQFEILLLEIKTENQALSGQVKQLRDQIRSLQREVDTSKELLQIKEIAHEDEINILRAQLGDPDQAKKKLAENIQLIRLQRDSRRASSWLSTLETQCKALESSLSSAQETNQQLESQLNSSQEELQQCQQQNLDLQKQVEEHRAEISRVKELEAQINSLQEENSILKEANDSLQGKVISAGEKVRKVESEEASLKSHISQMEITLKKEIQSKSDLYSEVSREKTKCQTLTETLKELQTKFSEMELELKRLEKTSESLSVPLVTYLEPGRHSPTVVVSSESQVYEDKSSTSTIIIEHVAERSQGVREQVISYEPSRPPVPVEIPLKDSTKTAEVNGDRPLSQCEYCRTLEKDLTNTRTNMDKLHDDLIKTKNLLKSQMNTNRECHKEIEVLSVKLEKADKFHHEKLQEFMKVLEERATQMQNLEKNLETIKSQTRIVAPTSDAEIQVTPRTPPEDNSTNKEASTPAPAIPSVEIFIDKFVPVESQKHLVNESLFATWEYNEDGTHYSPVVRNGNFSSGSLHSFDEESFQQNPIQVQIHQAIGSSDCHTLGKGILSPDQNSCTITSVISPEEPLGELKYKFLIKGADMKNVTAVRVEMAEKPKLDSPKKTEPTSSSNTNEDTPKKLPVPKPRTLSTQPEINISTSSQTEASDNENPIKIKRSKKKRFGGTLIPKPLDRIIDEEQVVHSPKRPILRKKSESPEVKRQPKKVTVAEIVEERQIPTTEDEKSVSSEGTYEIKRPLPENFSETSGDGGSDLSLARRLAAEAGYEIPVIQVQSSGSPDPPKSGPPPQDSTTEVSISSNSGDDTPAPAVSSDTSRKKKSKKKTRSPLGTEDSFDSTETSSLDSNSYKQSIRIEISYIVFNSPCRIWSDTKVKKIFVEYRFLDFDPEELETPSSVPKPQPGKKAEFNFIKVFIIDNKERRRLLQGMLREKKRIRFTIVSEPGENDTLDCEDIGYAYVPVTTLANEDLDHELIKIYDAENPRLEMGSLCVSIQARQVLKSL